MLQKKCEHLLCNEVLSYFISILNCIIAKNKEKRTNCTDCNCKPL